MAFLDKKLTFIEAIRKAKSTGGVLCRPAHWATDKDMKHYAISWHNPPGPRGCWVMTSAEDPDAMHMALMPSLEDIDAPWEITA